MVVSRLSQLNCGTIDHPPSQTSKSLLNICRFLPSADLLLICGDVESNPGPTSGRQRVLAKQPVHLEIPHLFQNVRGITDNIFRANLFRSVRQHFEIFAMVETFATPECHNEWTRSWGRGRGVWSSSSTQPQSCGVALLFADSVDASEIKAYHDCYEHV